MNYFSYGSNMETELLESRVGKINIIGKAVLKNYYLTFNKLGDDGSGKANIEQRTGFVVEGIIFDLTEEQLKKLDISEGVPMHYIRCMIEIIKSDNDEVTTAEVYIANKNKIRYNLRPNRQYLQYLLDGANEHKLSEKYKKFLESFEYT